MSRYADSIVNWLLEKYNEGERTKTKWSPQQIVESMKNEKNSEGTSRFQKDMLLNWRQVQSFFSRETSKRRKAQISGITRNEPNANDVLEEIDQNEGEEELTYQDDAFFQVSYKLNCIYCCE